MARLLDGEKMAVVGGEFEIARNTGYKNYVIWLSGPAASLLLVPSWHRSPCA